ncbi:cytokine-dependent hematopoietic cell linker isoform X3 [Falco biarmicus]|uniref:cytokine-dependent hematopoietic cell linker isoform X3 n=1 Tax=Falco peregrinus TaxID=8954 RepID=UPI00247B0B84|nr:cytokine-dependent hematopoietic cell linker isoform X3 [Falco peregrinus]XP_056192969.1 cytokine-dependent hematopoietic cell linker isoform X3 [Falco biarmicus]
MHCTGQQIHGWICFISVVLVSVKYCVVGRFLFLYIRYYCIIFYRMTPADIFSSFHTENRRIVLTNTYRFNKDLTMKGKSDLQSSSKVSEEEEGDYETVSSSTLEAIHALRILPAKPQQESEYADKHCLRPLGTASPTNSQDTSQPPQYLAKHTPVLEGRSMSSVRGERMKIHGPQDPIPPPRHLSVKELNEARGEEQVTKFGKKPETSFQAQQYKLKDHPEPSLQCMQTSKNVWSSGSTLNTENFSVKRSPSPTPHAACKNKSKHSLVKQEMQSLTPSTEKDLNKYEWYLGEYDRHEAEKALLQENTDETFLVRDCSKKSNAEPYVLVVYYGRRVYNIKIRFLEESQQYALGTGLRGDVKFNSVKEIIDFYKYVPITLIDGKDKSGIQRERCYLTYPFKSHRRCFLP